MKRGRVAVRGNRHRHVGAGLHPEPLPGEVRAQGIAEGVRRLPHSRELLGLRAHQAQNRDAGSFGAIHPLKLGHLGIELIHVDAGERFFSALAGVTEPEVKRKAIGEQFIRVFEENTGGLTDARFLVQGTLYPDLIESGGTDGAAAVLVCSEDYAGANGLEPLARVKSIAVGGCAPEIMGIGPVTATRKAIARAGIDLEDVDVVELNEAFAVQAIRVLEEYEKKYKEIRKLNKPVLEETLFDDMPGFRGEGFSIKRVTEKVERYLHAKQDELR